MKILKTLKRAALGAFITAAEKIGTVEQESEKRAGVFVARYLDPANAKKWHDWGVKYGIPNLVPPEEMHVTVVFSLVDVKLARDERPISVYTGPGYGDAGAFCMFGPANDTLVFCFSQWDLYNRHYEFLSNGAQTTWPSYRPHLTLSTDATGFELSDEALADVPTYIIMMGETNADLKAQKDDVDDDGAADAEEGDEFLVIVLEVAMSSAAAMLKADKEKPELPAMDSYALADVAKGHVTKGVAKRLAAIEWMPAEIKELAKAAPKPAKVMKTVERDFVLTMAPATKEMSKKLALLDVWKFDEEKRTATGWASVSKIGKEYVNDLQGDTITTEAQHQFIQKLFQGGAAAKLEHEGEVIGEVVEGIVFDADLQKALGIDLGMEGLLTTTHYTCDKTWEKVKVGDWMHSIAGTMLVLVEE